MITLDAKYHDYLTSGKTFDLDGCRERVTGYGYNCDGQGIIGYWVNTENWRSVSYTHLTLPTKRIV